MQTTAPRARMMNWQLFLEIDMKEKSLLPFIVFKGGKLKRRMVEGPWLSKSELSVPSGAVSGDWDG